jgi:hypothetical protein
MARSLSLRRHCEVKFETALPTPSRAWFSPHTIQVFAILVYPTLGRRGALRAPMAVYVAGKAAVG